MITHNIYYLLKPFIPRSLQIKLRRKVVLRKRLEYVDVWPIDKKADKPPQGWCGWPEEKRFALVITHDVEGSNGIQNCNQLAKLDESYGFRSSFNFVAEDCEVPTELLNQLENIGFEIGLHGLHHDGNLFRSKEKFREQAIRINRYLKKWESVGFRTPCMYHNLDWIHDLNIEYDSSTFDTDPFEPQPDGVGTIFPFWVPPNNPSNLSHEMGNLFHRDPTNPSNSINSSNPELVTRNPEPGTRYSEPSSSNLEPPTASAGGYVELPYTLPQDHSLFVIMNEKNIDIWKRKLDWIAECGGMALLITHPDYINFGEGKMGIEEYPAEYYKEFLQYVKSKYKGQYWHVLPKNMALFWSKRYKDNGLGKSM